MNDFIGIIPARYDSRRFPGKPLCDIDGITMIRRVYEQAIKWDKFDNVYVATDSDLIKEECEKWHIPIIMTSPRHNDCLDRAWEISDKLKEIGRDAKYYIIIQGDEPLFNVKTLDVEYDSPCINFYTESINDVHDPNSVKVVISKTGKALYFSRFSLPYCNEQTKRSDLQSPVYKQIGTYMFTGKMLKIYHELGPSMLENAEGIGLNRLLENDYVVQMKYTKCDSISVDTEQGRDKVVQILRNGQ